MLAAGDMLLPEVPRADRRDPDLSPLYADLTGMPPRCSPLVPPTTSSTTPCSWPRVGAAGNRAEMLLYPGAPHGCTGMPSVSAHWTPRLLDFLRSCLKD